MAGLFYSRYIPPAQPSSASDPLKSRTTPPQKKRKRIEVEADTRLMKPVGHDPKKNTRTKKSQDREGTSTQIPPPPKLDSNRSAEVDEQRPARDIEPFPSSTIVPKDRLHGREEPHEQHSSSPKELTGTGHRNPDRDHGTTSAPPLEPGQETPRTAIETCPAALSHRKHKRKKQNRNRANPEDDSSNTLSKHEKISTRYDRSKRAQAALETDAQRNSSKRSTEPLAEVIHGLEPLPQPSSEPDSAEQPTYSTLPAWLANPVQIRDDHNSPFDGLGIDLKLVSNLQNFRLINALPVQKSIIPMLVKGKHHYSSDLCVSAPTGSGKTLAYALPIINTLLHKVTTRLRGLIVVPTRELVAQVFKVCEMCASGTNISIATATGNRPMKEEQVLLIEKGKKLDPDAYDQMYSKPLTASDWESFGLEDLIEDIEDMEHDIPGYVPQYKSKVDLLICTPGRLVDHVRFTKGFTLEHIEMFAIDEGDKLLDDTFQEWVEVVLPALKTRCGISLADQILSDMGMETRPRIVQKIVLSATMTKDISKWNLLQLHKPKFIVVGEVGAQGNNIIDPKMRAEAQEEHGIFHLPQTLTESAIAVGDGMQKPLFLLQLLQSEIKPSSNDVVPDAKGRSVASDNKAKIHSSSSDTDTSSDSIIDTSDSDSISSITSKPSSLASSDRRKYEKQPPSSSALIFTRSSEAALRLRRLLILLEPQYETCTATVTKSLHSASSRDAIRLFQRNRVSILIATDRASRGLDLKGLGHVISYDVPPSVTAYVHRVGRTARAGKIGRTWTLVAHREGRWFWNEIGKGDRIERSDRVEKIHLQLPTNSGLEERYEQALRQLGEDVQSQERQL